MRKRGRAGLSRVGILAIALMVVVGAMGVVYSVWSSAIAIDTTVNTGIRDTEITCGTCGPAGIDCAPSGMTLAVDVVDAQDGVDYYCNFYISNDTGTGTLPVKIQSVTITPPLADWPTYPPYGFNGDVTFDSGTKTPETVRGDQIDPGEWEDGTIQICLDGANVGDDFHVEIKVDVVLWSDYEG